MGGKHEDCSLGDAVTLDHHILFNLPTADFIIADEVLLVMNVIVTVAAAAVVVMINNIAVTLCFIDVSVVSFVFAVVVVAILVINHHLMGCIITTRGVAADWSFILSMLTCITAVKESVASIDWHQTFGSAQDHE